MQKTPLFFGKCSLALATYFSILAPSFAANEDDGGWHYRITPYLWGAGLDGEVGKSQRRADVNKSVSDILDDIDYGGMLAFEARKGKYGIFSDILYVRLSESDSIPTPIGIDADADVKINAATFMLAGQYRAKDEKEGYIDLLAGARYWGLRTNVNVSLSNLFSVDGSDKEHWIDPVLGMKGTYHLDERFYLTGWAILGGFNVGSRLSSDLMGGLGYKVTDKSALLLAYRRLAVDYKSSNFLFDASSQGPALGWDYRF